MRNKTKKKQIKRDKENIKNWLSNINSAFNDETLINYIYESTEKQTNKEAKK